MLGGVSHFRTGPHDSPNSGVLLTGATGFVGMMVLTRLLEHTTSRVFVLVRARDDREAKLRVQRVLCCLFGDGHPYRERVVPVRGDITRPGLGLTNEVADSVASRVTAIIHGAASVSFELGLDACRRVNVHGTRQMLTFAERCRDRGGLRRFSYVSTAYVAGDYRGCFSERQLGASQRFRNPYERSKHEAERVVRAHMDRLPVTLFRPSIIVGERSTGWTSSFNVLYWPLRAFTRGTYLALPASGSSPVDVVPVDYVADAILTLTWTPRAESHTYHLTAGEDTSTVADIVSLATSHFSRRAPRLIRPRLYNNLLHPLLLRTVRDPKRRRALKRSEIFFPYFAARVTYDNRDARALLDPHGITPPPIEEYFDRLVKYAVDSDWGRAPLPRHVLAAPTALAPVRLSA